MRLTTYVLALAGLATAAINTTQEYYLKTALKPDQTGKDKYCNLYITSYHTGAGLNDVVLTSSRTNAETAFLSPVQFNTTNTTTTYLSNQLFDLGTSYPWGLLMDEDVNFYAAWEPVRLNAGVSGTNFEVAGFFINETGLQWTSDSSAPGTITDAFGGWLVCDWWHGSPQLFFRLSDWAFYGIEAPAGCADVWLMPEYI